MSFKREQRPPPVDKGDSVEKEVCRNFTNGHCTRGERCIYDHPKLDVCRDFQNNKCTRQTCRFAHATRDEELAYSNSGHLPMHVKNRQSQVGSGFDNNGILRKRDFSTMSGYSVMPISYAQQNSSPMSYAQQNSSPMSMSHLQEQGSLSDLCRDFEKGDCSRGVKCRYYHPKLIICRDFQNEKCEREKCRFLHMTREEEDTYEQSGVAPDHIDKEELRKKRVMNPSSVSGGHSGGVSHPVMQHLLLENPTLRMNQSHNEQDLCRDFEKGECSRGDRCKYFHPKLIICRDFQKKGCEREKCRFVHMTREEEDDYDASGIVPDHVDKDDLRKKRVMNPLSNGGGAADMSKMYGGAADMRNMYGQINQASDLSNATFTAMLQENVALKLKVNQMQQQVTDLRKMNDTLYEQNTNYRKYRKVL